MANIQYKCNVCGLKLFVETVIEGLADEDEDTVFLRPCSCSLDQIEDLESEIRWLEEN